MKNSYLLLIGLWCVCCFVACGNKEDEAAANLLHQAEACVERSEWNAAKIVLDSVRQQFSTNVPVLRRADTIAWQIQLLENERSLQYIDTILPQKVQEVTSLKRGFVFEKDSLYQDFGTYTHRSMLAASNVDRCYLKPMVDEQGKLTIISHYCGASGVEHHSLSLLADGVLYRVKNSCVYSDARESGYVNENLCLDLEESVQVAEFVSSRVQCRTKVTLIGRRDYVYYLTQVDKDAIAATTELAACLSDIKRLQTEREVMEAMNSKLRTRLQKH